MPQPTNGDMNRLAAALARLLADWWRSQQQGPTSDPSRETTTEAIEPGVSSSGEATAAVSGVAVRPLQGVQR